MNNNVFLSQDVLVNLSNSVKGKSIVNLDVLIFWECEIFMLLVKGKLVKEVVQILCIMFKIVYFYCCNIFEKLNCISSFEFIQFVLCVGLINSDDFIDFNYDYFVLF